jgi:hypothetical protein
LVDAWVASKVLAERSTVWRSTPGAHTLTWTGDVHPEVDLVPGDVVEATDGEVAHPAVVDSIEVGVLSLVASGAPRPQLPD